jgi:hypothetical protein
MVSVKLILAALATLAAASPACPGSKRSLTRRQDLCPCAHWAISTFHLVCEEIEPCHFCCEPADAEELVALCEGADDCHPEDIGCDTGLEGIHCGGHARR